MKRKAILIVVLSLAVVAAGYGLVQAHGEQSRGGSDSRWFGMGSGHMGGHGWEHMGSGGHMMGSGWGHMGRGLGGLFGGSHEDLDDHGRVEHPLSGDEARRVVQYRLGNNPRVRIGGMIETGIGFEFDIVTREGLELVDRLMVEKDTGRTYPIR